MGLLPSESKEAIKGGYQPPSSSEPSHVEAPPNLTTASLYGSKDALTILHQICTPASLLFDPKYTSRERPSPLPPFRTFPPSPTAQRIPFSVPSTISVQNLDKEESQATMDKRHPSSFQQLEKLGEGTYATVGLYCFNFNFMARNLTGAGLQRTEPPDRRAGSAQGDPSRFRRGDSEHCHPRNLSHERAQARERCLPARCHPHRK